MNLQEIRQKHPYYDKVDDKTLADAIYEKSYSHADRDKFNLAIGYEPEAFFSMKNFTPEGGVGEVFDTLSEGAADAITMGFADRIKDAGNITGQYIGDKIMGKDYGEHQSVGQRAFLDQWGKSAEERRVAEKKNPKTALAGNVLGFVGNPGLNQLTRGAIGQLPRTGLNEMDRVGQYAAKIMVPQSKKKTAAKLAGLGGATGAVYGAGKEGTVEGALTQGAIGAGAALATTGLVNVGGWTLGKLQDYILKSSGQRQVSADLRLLSQALEDSGWTVETASKELERLGPRAVLADLGDPMARLTFKAYTKSPDAIRKGFQDRQQGVGEPGYKEGGQAQTVDDILKKISPKTLRETKKGLSKSRAGDLYAEAEKANLSMMSPEINRILNTTAGRKAWAMAKDSMRDAGENLAIPNKELTALGGEQGIVTGSGIADDGLKLRFLNEVKKHLWDLEQAAKKSGPFGDKPTRASDVISENRSKFISEMDRLDETAKAGPSSMKTEGGAYKRARAIEGERLQGLDMLAEGKKFRLSGNIEDARELLGKATPEQIDAFRAGFVEDLRGIVGKTKRWNDVSKKIQGSEIEDQKIKLVFGAGEKGEETFRNYMNTVANEGQMYGTGARVMQGSKTAEMTEALKNNEIDPGRMLQAFMDLKRGMTGDFSSLLRGGTNMAKGAFDHATMSTSQADRLSKLLMGRDMSKLKDVYTPMVENRNLQAKLARLLMQAGKGPSEHYSRR